MHPPSPPTGPFVELRGVERSYPMAGGACAAVRGVDLRIGRGEFVALTGRSGSGKTTLLNLIAGIDRPTAGAVAVGGTRIDGLDEDRLASWRGRNVGVVFQFFQLLPTLSVLENVMLPMDLATGLSTRSARGRALDLLARVGIADQAGKLPAMLSGGQQQRAAIARALANDPPLVLADEPTGNLDSRTAAEVLALFAATAAEGRTVVMVTHEAALPAGIGRVVALADGRVAPAGGG